MDGIFKILAGYGTSTPEAMNGHWTQIIPTTLLAMQMEMGYPTYASMSGKDYWKDLFPRGLFHTENLPSQSKIGFQQIPIL